MRDEGGARKVHSTQYTVHGSQSTEYRVLHIQGARMPEGAERPKNRWAVYRLQFSDFRKPLAVYQNPVISKSTLAWISQVSTIKSVGSTSGPRIDLRMDAIIGIWTMCLIPEMLTCGQSLGIVGGAIGPGDETGATNTVGKTDMCTCWTSIKYGNSFRDALVLW